MADQLIKSLRAAVEAERAMNKARYGCNCKVSDSWACSRLNNYPGLSCPCACHRRSAARDGSRHE